MAAEGAGYTALAVKLVAGQRREATTDVNNKTNRNSGTALNRDLRHCEGEARTCTLHGSHSADSHFGAYH